MYVTFRKTKTTLYMFLDDIDDSYDYILTDMYNFIVIHIPLDGTLLAIDHFISRTLNMWIQYKIFLFQGNLI